MFLLPLPYAGSFIKFFRLWIWQKFFIASSSELISNIRIISYFVESESVSLLIHSKYSLTGNLWDCSYKQAVIFLSLDKFPLISTVYQACDRLVVLVLMESPSWCKAWYLFLLFCYFYLASMVLSKIPYRVAVQEKNTQVFFWTSLTHQLCLEQFPWVFQFYLLLN